MKIGIIGGGKIGKTVGRLWLSAGHQICFGSRNPEAPAESLHINDHAVAVKTVEEAASFGDVIFSAAPYGAWPQIAELIRDHVAGKLVMDAANPYPQRDGEFATQALEAGQGAGIPVARLLPNVHLVRAFSTVYFQTLASEAHRDGDLVGIPIAGDDPAALESAEALIREAGFEPVRTGGLATARFFDPGATVYNTGYTAAQIRTVLAGIPKE